MRRGVARNDVLASWSGLGYYRRARLLHAGAVYVAELGSVPNARASLREVPGIGPNRKRALLMHFGTARAVKGAALEDLERAPGIRFSDVKDVKRVAP